MDSRIENWNWTMISPDAFFVHTIALMEYQLPRVPVSDAQFTVHLVALTSKTSLVNGNEPTL